MASRSNGPPRRSRDEEPPKAGYDTFMMKEITSSPEASPRPSFDRLTDDDSVDLSDIGFGDGVFRKCSRIVIVACGTSYHAGLCRPLRDRTLGRPRSRWTSPRVPLPRPVIGEDDLVIGITQSGETADTLAAMRLARDRGAGSRDHQHHGQPGDPRLGRPVLFTRAGWEIGVAATRPSSPRWPPCIWSR